MNIFRFFGDLSHLASIFILLYAIETNRSTNGLSLKLKFYTLWFISPDILIYSPNFIPFIIHH